MVKRIPFRKVVLDKTPFISEEKNLVKKKKTILEKKIQALKKTKSILDLQNFSKIELHIYNLSQLYCKFMVQCKNFKVYKIFKTTIDPRKQLKKWNRFLDLYESLVEEQIEPKTYFHFHFRINKSKSYVWYWIGNEFSMTAFKEWELKVKARKVDPNSLAYSGGEEKQQLKYKQYDILLKEKMRQQGIYSEDKFWQSCGIDELREFSKEYLKFNKSFRKSYKQGYFKGLKVF